MNKKVSIIIPNYNRAHLISYTLNSILDQDYTNWECIIVDDSSTDNSLEIIDSYLKRDTRFRLYNRPYDMPKGANSARNYGLKMSTGFYIQWFDSDDIMTKNHLSALVSEIINSDADFAVGISENFSEANNFNKKLYDFERDSSKINVNNYARLQIEWITDDFLCKREILKGLKFNESFKTDGDEYNFFTQLLFINSNGVFVNDVLTLRRIHKDTLSDISEMSELAINKKIAVIKYLTFSDIEKYNDSNLKRWFLSGYMQYSFKIALKNEYPPFYKMSIRKIAKHFSILQCLNFILAIYGGYYFGKGYKFLRASIQF